MLRMGLAARCNSMPTVLRIGPYRFHFYSRESNEPPHIHVAREDFEVKFWLNPVAVATNYGFPLAEVNRIRKLIEENCDFLIKLMVDFMATAELETEAPQAVRCWIEGQACLYRSCRRTHYQFSSIKISKAGKGDSPEARTSQLARSRESSALGDARRRYLGWRCSRGTIPKIRIPPTEFGLSPSKL